MRGRDRGAERHPRAGPSTEHEGEGGTIVVPGHGYVSDEHEVVEYRDMVVIVRDRVQAMISEGRDAGAGEGGAAHRRLRHAIRRDVGAVDDRHVRRGCLPRLCRRK